ncbi:MAG: hypothetical protein ABEJ73_02720 [Haloplanus sp.]
MGLSRSDKINLGLLIGSGVLLAVASIGFRVVVGHPLLGFPRSFFALQYSLGFIFFGLLVLLLWKANTEVGKIGLSVLTFAVGVGLLFPPVSLAGVTQIITNLVYVGLVVSAGVLHYRFNKPPNTLVIAGISVMTLEHYLFGVTYSLLGFARMGRPVFFVAVLVLTMILFVFRNILGRELDKTHDNSTLANYLDTALNTWRI